MPALSSTMTEGKIVSWLKSPGDKVAKGESVVGPFRERYNSAMRMTCALVNDAGTPSYSC